MRPLLAALPAALIAIASAAAMANPPGMGKTPPPPPPTSTAPPPPPPTSTTPPPPPTSTTPPPPPTSWWPPPTTTWWPPPSTPWWPPPSTTSTAPPPPPPTATYTPPPPYERSYSGSSGGTRGSRLWGTLAFGFRFSALWLINREFCGLGGGLLARWHPADETFPVEIELEVGNDRYFDVDRSDWRLVLVNTYIFFRRRHPIQPYLLIPFPLNLNFASEGENDLVQPHFAIGPGIAYRHKRFLIGFDARIGVHLSALDSAFPNEAAAEARLLAVFYVF